MWMWMDPSYEFVCDARKRRRWLRALARPTGAITAASCRFEGPKIRGIQSPRVGPSAPQLSGAGTKHFAVGFLKHLNVTWCDWWHQLKVKSKIRKLRGFGWNWLKFISKRSNVCHAGLGSRWLGAGGRSTYEPHFQSTNDLQHMQHTDERFVKHFVKRWKNWFSWIDLNCML